MKPANSTFASLGTTIFTVMSALAQEHGAINLGQGFPDDEGPDDVRAVAAKALIDGQNQYPPMMGLPALRQAVAENNRRFYGLDLDWREEVVITSGATEALAACLLALLSPGDEAVVIEPLYDSYLPIIRVAGAVPKIVSLRPPDWSLPLDALEAAFSDKTKLVLMNSPMNPTAKVFSLEELTAIADLAKRYDAIAICDEVYEHLVFSGHKHIPIMTLPGMRERTARIGSAGKTLSLTGWKVGYISAGPELLKAISKAHQFLTFTTPPNLQAAVAYGLNKDDAFFTGLSTSLEAKRDILAAGLKRAGFDVLETQGTYFMNADFRPLGFNGPDDEFCQFITKEAGVAAVPVSAFCEDAKITHLARFCFCKRDEVLHEACDRLARFFDGRAA